MDARFCAVGTLKPGRRTLRSFPISDPLAHPVFHEEISCTTYVDIELDNMVKKTPVQHKITIMHANVRDLRIVDRLPNLGMLLKRPSLECDITVVSETWFRSPEEARCFNIEGYKQTGAYRIHRRGGGVSIFVRDDWELVEESSKTSEFDDVQIARTVVQKDGKYITVIGFYSRAKSSEETLVDLLEKFMDTGVKGVLVMAGDANVDLSARSEISLYASWLASRGMLQCISGITRPASNSCLDHIWVSQYPIGSKFISGIIRTTSLADHYPVFLVISGLGPSSGTVETAKESKRAPRRVFSSNNFLAFSQLLQSTDWSKVLETADPDAANEIFTTKLYEIYDTSFPVNLFKCMNEKKSDTWFDTSLRVARRYLDRLHKQVITTQSKFLKAEHTKQRREYRRRVRLSYTSYYRRLLERMGGTPRKLWQCINSCTGRVSKAFRVPNAMKVKGTIFVGPTAIANAMCEYFSTVGRETAPQASDHDSSFDVLCFKPPESTGQPNQISPKFQLTEISFTDISRNAAKLKADLKGSISSVPSKILKQYVGCMLVPLHHIFNRSIDQGKFPSKWKDSTYIPIYKGKGDKDNPSSYRPIAITPFFAKLLERCVKEQMERHFEATGYFSQSQHGFRSKHSTDIALCSMTDFITKNCEGGNAVAAVFLDVAKAFDCISHEVLFSLMELHQFSSATLAWFKSYLVDRHIAVRVHGVRSEEKPVGMGVPQGSVLGPYIFIFYINMLLALGERDCPGVKIVAYADDTTVLYRIKNRTRSEDVGSLMKYISHIYTLFDKFRLSVNTNKTKIVVFKAAQSNWTLEDLNFSVRGVQIDVVDSGECLGLLLSSDLKWKEHYRVLSRKCYGVISTLARLKQLGYSRQVLITVFRALFEPVLFYGIPVWGTTYYNVLGRIQTLQNDALRAIYGLKRRQSVRFVFKQQKILSVTSSVKFKVALLVYNALNKGWPVEFINARPIHPRDYSLRSSGSIVIHHPVCRTVLREQGPEAAFAKIWNDLPNTIKTCKTVNGFKSKLKEHLLERNFAKY